MPAYDADFATASRAARAELVILIRARCARRCRERREQPGTWGVGCPHRLTHDAVINSG